LVGNRHYLMMLGVAPRPCLAGALWTRLIEDLASEGYLAPIWLPALRHIQRHGPLARRLLDALGSTPSRRRMKSAYEKLCQCLRDGRMFGG
ncbi:MAG: glutamate--cysteine ligase, partial [Betaproteobacteria bacterium]